MPTLKEIIDCPNLGGAGRCMLDGSFCDPDCCDDYQIFLDLGSHSAPCKHEWVEYQGLKESYQYCKICGEKRR
jgi:hypothetical protein